MMEKTGVRRATRWVGLWVLVSGPLFRHLGESPKEKSMIAHVIVNLQQVYSVSTPLSTGTAQLQYNFANTTSHLCFGNISFAYTTT